MIKYDLNFPILRWAEQRRTHLKPEENCLRMIYHLFECPTKDLHLNFHLPTLEEKFRKSSVNRLSSIERHEQELISCYIMNKTIINKTRQHYQEKPCIPALPRGRPSTRLIKFYQDTPTFFDKLLQFTIQSSSNQLTSSEDISIFLILMYSSSSECLF